MTIHKRGKYEEAVRLQRKVLAGRERVLGHSHRSTLETLNALGYDLRSLGRHKEAEEIHRRELIEKQKLFDQYPDDVHIQYVNLEHFLLRPDHYACHETCRGSVLR